MVEFSTHLCETHPEVPIFSSNSKVDIVVATSRIDNSANRVDSGVGNEVTLEREIARQLRGKERFKRIRV